MYAHTRLSVKQALHFPCKKFDVKLLQHILYNCDIKIYTPETFSTYIHTITRFLNDAPPQTIKVFIALKPVKLYLYSYTILLFVAVFQ